MFGNILHRMILWELTKVFVMSLVGITGILLMAGIIAEASQQGLGPAQILAAIPLLIPSTLPYTIPATTLFATCVVYGRLAADNEILAIKAAGINVIKVVRPGVVLGLVMSGADHGPVLPRHPLHAPPAARDGLQRRRGTALLDAAASRTTSASSSMPYAMFVKSVQGRKLLNPIFKQHDKNRRRPTSSPRPARPSCGSTCTAS